MSTTARKEKRVQRLVRGAQSASKSIPIPYGYVRENDIRIDGGVPLVTLKTKTEREGRLLLEARGFTNPVVLYHGTQKDRFPYIAREGLCPGRRGGMLGSGVYFGGRAKARKFSSDAGVLLECLVDLGRVWIPTEESRPNVHLYPPEMHTIYASEGLQNEEWCVRDPQRIVILRAFYLLGKEPHYSWSMLPPLPQKRRIDGTPLGPSPAAAKILSVTPKKRDGRVITTPPRPARPVPKP
jgi:hypothetical protein